MLDTKVSFGVVLEGGGARGSYQVGAWKALDEMGIKYNAVSGTSVGALNGALMAMRDLPLASEIWNNITFSQVMDVNDDLMREFFKINLHPIMIGKYISKVRELIKNKGISTAPLKKLLSHAADESRIRYSDVNMYFPVYCITDKKGYYIDAKELEYGKLHDMLLASSCFPLFQKYESDGKKYIDGGVFDVLPITPLIARGCRNLIIIRLNGFGTVRRVHMPPDANVINIKPSKNLGSVMNFDSQVSQKNMKMGYDDTMKLFEKLFMHKT